MKKRICFLGLVFMLIFACKNNMQTGTDINSKRPVKPVLVKLEVRKTVDDTLIFSETNFTDNLIDAGIHEVESVKIKIEAENSSTVKFEPDLEGAVSDEFTLKIVGENFLNIILTGNGNQNVYILKITRRQADSNPPRKIKNLKADFGWTPSITSAVPAVKDAADDKSFKLNLDHNKGGSRYSIFVEGEDSEDVVVVQGKTETFKADNSRISCGNLPETGKSAVLVFYLFQKDVDTVNLGLGTKFELTIEIAKEPNTKISSVRFNGKEGVINGNIITCEAEFDVDTVITTDAVCEDTSSSAVVNDGNEVRISASGAVFKIIVTPKEGDIYKTVYNVTLKAKTENLKRVTGIKWTDGSLPSTQDDLTETSERNQSNVCIVNYTENNFSFVPVVSEGIVKTVQKKSGGVFTGIDPYYSSGCYVIQKRDCWQLETGITIKVIFTDGKSDEFVIKKN